jgi:8-amino-7-oxononanoate synthase
MGRIEEFLKERKDNGLLRILRPADVRENPKIRFKEKEYIDLSSNDYLGLSNHPKLKEAARAAIEELGTSSSASRLLSGDLKLCHKLEERIADFKEKERALVFNSGYQANVGIIGSIFSGQDAIFSDRLNHASIIDGILLSKAKSFRFRHNDVEHLELLLKKERHKFSEALIVTESIFSMDGDKAPIKDLIALKRRYDCRIMVDEAHATGIFGKNGSGIIEEEGLSEEVDLIMGTFGKALGGFGAYLASSSGMIDYLINSCRSFMYSTALPPSVIAADLAGLDVIKEEPYRREALCENSAFFRDGLIKAGFSIKGSSQIVPVIIGDSRETVSLSQKLQNRGYWALPIRPPTVPAGESRLRFSLTYNHTREILEGLIYEMRGINRF